MGAFKSLATAGVRRSAATGGGRKRIKLRLSDLLNWDEKELKQLENAWMSVGKRDGRKAIRNAHKASIDVLNEKARDEIRGASFGPTGKRYKRGGGTVTHQTKGGKDRHVQPFRAGVVKKTSWSFRTFFNASGATTTSWLNKKQYLNYLGPMWESGFTPGKGTKYQGSKVGGIGWRYGVARREKERRDVTSRMIKALRHMMEHKGKPTPLKPKELRNVIR